MNAADERHAGTASGINNAVSRAAGLLAVALMSLLVLHTFDRELARRLAAMNVAPDMVVALDAERVKLAAAVPPPGTDASDQVAIRRAVAVAFVAGFRQMALLAAGLAIASALIAATMIGQRTPASRFGAGRRR